MKRQLAILTALAFVFSANSTLFADATGDTYSFAVSAFNTDFSNGGFPIATSTLTFGSGPHDVGGSSFGQATDTAIVEETITSIDADTDMYTIEVYGRDQSGGLTNLFADGSQAGGLPFRHVFFELGNNINGGSDRLNPGAGYTLDAVDFYIIGTGGGQYREADVPFSFYAFNSLEEADGFGGGPGVNFGGDVATVQFSGEEFAGFGMSYTITIAAIPETGSLLAIAMGTGLLLMRRRKN